MFKVLRNPQDIPDWEIKYFYIRLFPKVDVEFLVMCRASTLYASEFPLWRRAIGKAFGKRGGQNL